MKRHFPRSANFLKAQQQPSDCCLDRRPLLRAIYFFTLLGASINAGAQSRSDILIVLDNDGISYTAQHTMIADDELVTTKLPAKRETLETVFSGPGSTLYRRAHEKDPDEITLVSGTVFTRFRHRFNGSALTTDTGSGPSSDASTNTESDNDTSTGPIYSASLDQIKTSVKNLESFVYNVSWLLPSNIELLSYKPVEVAQSNSPTASFTWQQNGPVVTFTQTGGTPAIPSIEYRVKVNTQDQELPADIDCQPAQPGAEDPCIADTDLDSVPDYRDLCITADKAAGDSKLAVRPAESLGCDDDEVIELSELIFESGQSYLNVKARSQLDKVAIALQNLPELRYQIATFTDSAGNQQENQRLSQSRADAIRHYLVLRGVGPNQIEARGFGETSRGTPSPSAPLSGASEHAELQRLPG